MQTGLKSKQKDNIEMYIKQSGYTLPEVLSYIRTKAANKLSHMNDGKAKENNINTLINIDLIYSLKDCINEISKCSPPKTQNNVYDEFTEREKRIQRWIEYHAPYFDGQKQIDENFIGNSFPEKKIINSPVDAFGNTALHHAAEKGGYDEVHRLIQEGADAQIKNNSGQKPIDKAINSIERVDGETEHEKIESLLRVSTMSNKQPR